MFFIACLFVLVMIWAVLAAFGLQLPVCASVFLEGWRDVGANVPPDYYPGAVPAGGGTFLPYGSGRPGEQFPTPGGDAPRNPGSTLPYGSGRPGSSPYQDANENCRRIYNGINAVSQDAGHPGRGVSNDPSLSQAREAMDSCYDQGWSPNFP